MLLFIKESIVWGWGGVGVWGGAERGFDVVEQGAGVAYEATTFVRRLERQQNGIVFTGLLASGPIWRGQSFEWGKIVAVLPCWRGTCVTWTSARRQPWRKWRIGTTLGYASRGGNGPLGQLWDTPATMTNKADKTRSVFRQFERFRNLIAKKACTNLKCKRRDSTAVSPS